MRPPAISTLPHAGVFSAAAAGDTPIVWRLEPTGNTFAKSENRAPAITARTIAAPTSAFPEFDLRMNFSDVRTPGRLASLKRARARTLWHLAIAITHPDRRLF